MEGWIKLHRKLMEWEWYHNSNMVHLFIHLLFKANRTEKKWKGINIERGQLITGRNKLSEETGLSERQIRTCLQRLNKTGETTSRTTNRFSIITINEYDSYQITENENDQPNANKRPTNDQQTTTTKERKNLKNVKKKEKNNIKEAQLPWENEEFKKVWEFWKKYKKEQFRFTYKPIGEQGALSKLYELSDHKLDIAMLIIKQSIQNGWSGLFELKGKFKNHEYDREAIFKDL